MLAGIKRRAKQKYGEILMQVLCQYQREKGFAVTEIKVLDVGAGACWLLHSLPLQCTKVGIDISPHHQFDDDTFPKFLAEASSHFVFADATQMPFPDYTFDIVFSNEFVSHVYDIDKAVAEQIRILKKGGVMLIMDANFLNPLNFITNFLVDYIRTRGKLGGFRWLLHRDETLRIRIPTKQGFKEINEKSENTHSRRWWIKKLGAYSPEIRSDVSTFCSFTPFGLPWLLSNKILAIGHKL